MIVGLLVLLAFLCAINFVIEARRENRAVKEWIEQYKRSHENED